jgi:hypothetical protein
VSVTVFDTNVYNYIKLCYLLNLFYKFIDDQQVKKFGFLKVKTIITKEEGENVQFIRIIMGMSIIGDKITR